MRTTAPPAALAVAVAFVFAAGCISSPADGGDEAAAPEPPTVLESTGQVTASGPMLAIGSEGFVVAVTPNVTLLLAEIAWEDPTQDIDLALASPSAGTTGGAQTFDHRAEGGAPGMPDSPHRLAVEVPETGDWQASAFANGASAMVEYRVAVTLFHGETAVPEGYTALG